MDDKEVLERHAERVKWLTELVRAAYPGIEMCYKNDSYCWQLDGTDPRFIKAVDDSRFSNPTNWYQLRKEMRKVLELE